MKKWLINILLCVACSINVVAQLSDESVVYLVSCTPGLPAWAYYGHTAIRIKDAAQHFDCYYNYGLFDFNQEHFYTNFIKGHTDYILGREDSLSFYYNYDEMDREIYYQQLNLTLEQRNQLLMTLEINALPENRTYRYNFVFNNCATKPYELIRQVLKDDLLAPEYAKRSDTFRERIEWYSGKNTWNGWGINLLFGRDADQIMTTEQRLFLPEEVMDYAEEAVISSTGERLVVSSDVQPFVPRDAKWIGSPNFTILLLCLLIIGLTVLDVIKHRISWYIDAILFAIYGLLGCLLTYLACFSEHPFVSSNFNIIFFNPLMLIFFALCLSHKGRLWFLKSDLFFAVYAIIGILIYLLSGQTFHSIMWIVITHCVRIRFTWYGNVFLLGQKFLKKVLKHVAIIVFLALATTANAAQPQLTVVIAVDGLNNNTLQQITPQLLPGGLRTIIDEGHASRIYFPHLVNGDCETLATIMTGVTPFYHGISCPTRFDRENKTIVPLFQDHNYIGIGSRLHYSPKAILTPTLTDIFRLNNGKQSRIYAIGINPENTIVLAGHAANACVWLDTNGKQPYWATTNYYPIGLHPIAYQMNNNGKLANIFSPLLKTQRNAQPIPAQYSTYANSAVISLACEIQEKEQLGEGLQNDLLLLELNCRSANAKSDNIETIEQKEIINRLNQDLQTLVNQLFRRIGSQKVRIVLIGKPEQGYSTEALEEARLPHGNFNVSQAAALLNTYLMAMYGNGQYILGGHYNSLYLNHTLFEKRKINTEQLIQLSTHFLLEFEGIHSVYNTSQIPLIQGSVREQDVKLRGSYNKQCCGDLLFTLQSGYSVVNSDGSTDKISESDPEAPVIILGSVSNMPNSFDATQLMSIILND